jgi:hypothetical protein
VGVEIQEQQENLNRALLASDGKTLNELVAPKARIVGPKGFLTNREEWIGVHAESVYEQVNLETRETETTDYDTAAIRVDVVDSECRYRGETILGLFRVMQVWVIDGERWQRAAIQYTALAQAA